MRLEDKRWILTTRGAQKVYPDDSVTIATVSSKGRPDNLDRLIVLDGDGEPLGHEDASSVLSDDEADAVAYRIVAIPALMRIARAYLEMYDKREVPSSSEEIFAGYVRGVLGEITSGGIPF